MAACEVVEMKNKETGASVLVNAHAEDDQQHYRDLGFELVEAPKSDEELLIEKLTAENKELSEKLAAALAPKA